MRVVNMTKRNSEWYECVHMCAWMCVANTSKCEYGKLRFICCDRPPTEKV